jgi:hypothetical protein
MQIQRVLFSLMLAFLVSANCLAQDEKTETSSPKATKAKARAIKATTTQLLKAFGAANLTDEQKEKAAALVEKHIQGVLDARAAEGSFLTAAQKKARTDAIAKAKKDGVKGKKVAAAAVAAMGLSEEQLAEYNAVKKNVNAAQNKIKDAITALLTDEQETSLSKKGKGGKKKDGVAATTGNGKTQKVSLKLPGMT